LATAAFTRSSSEGQQHVAARAVVEGDLDDLLEAQPRPRHHAAVLAGPRAVARRELRQDARAQRRRIVAIEHGLRDARDARVAHGRGGGGDAHGIERRRALEELVLERQRAQSRAHWSERPQMRRARRLARRLHRSQRQAAAHCYEQARERRRQGHHMR